MQLYQVVLARIPGDSEWPHQLGTVQFSYLLGLSAEFDQLATSYFLTHIDSMVTITLFFSNFSKFLTVPLQFPLLEFLSSNTDLLNLYEVVISMFMTHLYMPRANLTCLKTYTSNGYLSSASLVPQIHCMPRIKPTIPSPNLLLLQGWLFYKYFWTITWHLPSLSSYT